MSFFRVYLAILALIPLICGFEKFNDNVLFGINWPGPLKLREGQVTEDGKDYISNHDAVLIKTPNNEKYHCLMPAKQIHPKSFSGEYGHGTSPENLISSLADGDGHCSFRLEAYWTYELCHNKHVRQFHEERTQKGTKLQEFYLGRINQETAEATEPQPIPEPPQSDHPPNKIPTRKLEGKDMPYFKVIMKNGTPCDLLSGRPRETHILYFCHPHGNNEILSLKEISTCIYEMEVVTPSLCSNDMYRFQEDPVHEISCHSLDSSPEQPQSYRDFIEQQELEKSGTKQTMLFEQGHQQEETSKHQPSQQPEKPRVQNPLPDDQLTKDFLNGDYCLQGGTGWWKHELCLGKKVLQFHVDEDHGGREDILLGQWNKEDHIKWVQSKNVKQNENYAVHLYTGGDVCDITGKPRQVQVRLRCMESSHLQQVAIYLMEPEVCQYILGVESPIICPLLSRMDKYGLFK